MKRSKTTHGFKLILTALLAVCLTLGALSGPVSATPEGKKAAEEKKAEEEKKKQEAEGNKQDTEAYLNELTNKAESLNRQAAEIQEEYKAKKDEIAEVTAQLEAAEATAKTQYANMRMRIKLMYEKGTNGYLEAILQSGSISEMLNKARYVSEIFGFDKSMLENYNAKIADITAMKNKLEKDRDELAKLSEKARENISYASSSMEEAKNELKAYIASIADSEEKIKQLEKEIIVQGASVGTGEGKKGNQTKEKEVVQGDGVTVTAEELDMIAAMVYCEAGAEGYEEMLGVASVIVNRLKSPKYPDTVEAVLWQSGQFAPTWEGKFVKALAKGAPDVCYKAAKQALSGYSNVGTSIGFKLASTGIEGIVIGKIVFFG